MRKYLAHFAIALIALLVTQETAYPYIGSPGWLMFGSQSRSILRVSWFRYLDYLECAFWNPSEADRRREDIIQEVEQRGIPSDVPACYDQSWPNCVQVPAPSEICFDDVLDEIRLSFTISRPGYPAVAWSFEREMLENSSDRVFGPIDCEAKANVWKMRRQGVAQDRTVACWRPVGVGTWNGSQGNIDIPITTASAPRSPAASVALYRSIMDHDPVQEATWMWMHLCASQPPPVTYGSVGLFR